MKIIIFAFFILYFLAVFQVSFAPHIDIFGIIPNFVLIIIVLFNFFESPAKRTGYVMAVIGGFYSEVFSFRNYGFFGFYTILFFCISFFLKFFLNKYVRLSVIKKKQYRY